MDHDAIRRLIQDKLTDGRLPHDSIPRLWGGQGRGEICDACGVEIVPAALIMEGIALEGRKPLQLHVQCFYLWDAARRDASGAVER